VQPMWGQQMWGHWFVSGYPKVAITLDL
jgi:hypothetical protein